MEEEEYDIFMQGNEIEIDFECLSVWNGHDTDNEEGSLTLNLDTLTPEILGNALEERKFTTRFCRLEYRVFNVEYLIEIAKGSHHINNWKSQ